MLQSVMVRWDVLASHPSPTTRFDIDLQTTGSVKVLSSFLKLKLKPSTDGRASVNFIIRDATVVDVEELEAGDRIFPTGEEPHSLKVICGNY